MKSIIRILVTGAIALVVSVIDLKAQKVDDERMQRDIAVAENVLGTLIKQEFDQQRMFFPLEVSGSYQPGYGVTFRLPSDYTTPIALTIGGANGSSGGNNVVIWGDAESSDGSGNYVYRIRGDNGEILTEDERPALAETKALTLKDKKKEKKRMDLDSVRNVYNDKVIEAAKNFIVDYGDMVSQLEPTERIVITNQGDQPRAWVNQYFKAPKRTHLAIEASRADITSFKQGKLTREQALSKIKVVNTESTTEVAPDLELLSSIIGRLYRSDLSKTYFTDNNIYYERLKDFGVVYYMQAVSSNRVDYARFDMPTVGLQDIDLVTRNKKVKELYPKFESELKENILEYGRTLKSLGDNEVLVFNVSVTQCKDCGIPSSLEITVKGSVLKDFSAGKADKNAALSKFTVKKGPAQ